ncbi:alpha/beta hydrolase family protein [Roseateles paludis]|uniref:Prolyl oligopeptidase family serine peptidase n=1 Tax=Roseateles paludis TaxID=3145238 RepID=A0ABV0G1D4_9BURK
MNAFLLRLATVAALTLGHCAWAAPDVEAFLRERVTRSVTLSPSGQRVAIVSYVQESYVLAVYELDGSGKVTPLVRSSEPIPDRIHWLDEDRLLFLSQNGLADWPRNDWHLATMVKPSVQMVDSLRNRRVLAIQRRSASRPVVQEVLIDNGGRFSDGFPSLAWYNLDTKQEREVDYSVPKNMQTLFINADLVASYGFSHEKRDDKVYERLHWRSPKSGEWKLLHESLPGEEPYRVVGAERDGTLYVSHVAGPQQVITLSRFDPASETTPSRAWIQTPGFDFVGHLELDAATSEVVGARVHAEDEVTVWLRPGMTAFQERVDQRFPGRVNRISCQRCAEPDMVAEIFSYSDRQPGEYWVFRAGQRGGKDAWTRVGRTRPHIDAEQSATSRLHRIPTRDGRTLPVWVTRPPSATGPLPAVVLLPDWAWDKRILWGWHWLPQLLASRGYLVIEPEVRGRSGYGADHVKASHGQVGLAMQDDVEDALAWAQAQGLAGTRACLLGENYGGVSTIFALERPKADYACGVARDPLMDFEPFLTEAHWSRLSHTAAAVKRDRYRKILGDLDRDAELAANLSPLTRSSSIRAPLLIFRAEQNLGQMRKINRLETQLRDRGQAVELVIERKRLTPKEREQAFLSKLEAFLAAHLSPP